MVSLHFLLAALSGMSGGPFLYGYNMGVINTPALFMRDFYVKAYASRAGLYPFDYTAANVSNSSASNSSDIDFTSPSFDESARLRQLEVEFGIDLLWTITISIFLIGGMVGAFASGKMADNLGRKRTLLIIQAVNLLSALASGLARPTGLPELMVLSRFLVGVSNGVGLGLAPLYLGELATPTLRGPATAACQLAVNFGTLIAQLLGLVALLGNEDLWPYLLIFNAVPSCLTLLTLPFCPESPRHMINTRPNDFQQVRRAYVWLYGESRGEAEAIALRREVRRRTFLTKLSLGSFSSLRRESFRRTRSINMDGTILNFSTAVEDTAAQNCSDCDRQAAMLEASINGAASTKASALVCAENEDEDLQVADERSKKANGRSSQTDAYRRQESGASQTVTLMRLFCSEEFRLPMFLSFWLHITQQWSGVGAVASYSSTVFKQVLPADLVQYAVLSTGAMAMVGTSMVLLLMSRLGRRPLILMSCLLMVCCQFSIVLCSTLGYLSPILNYCCAVLVSVFFVTYAGCGCAPATLVSEMFLQNARAVAMSIAVATRWGSAFLLLLVFPYMWTAMGIYSFLVFGFVCLASLVIFYLWLHETRGRSASMIHKELAHGFVRVHFDVHYNECHLHLQSDSAKC